jgi:phosphoadenosine phosphosulfate reductase
MFDCLTYPASGPAPDDSEPAAMPVPDQARPGQRAHVAHSLAVICDALTTHPGRIAAVSAFGAESAILLALVAEIDRALPIIFVDTRQHFPETLAYRDMLAERLGLTGLRNVAQQQAALAAADPTGELWRYDPDACCALRKVTPLDQALAPFNAWITGRKRHQARTRSALPLVERVGGKQKYNPLAAWTAEQIEAEMQRRALPRHPLSLAGYPSIGCAVCTRAIATGEDPRAGRWSGTGKTECGIHRS